MAKSAHEAGGQERACALLHALAINIVSRFSFSLHNVFLFLFCFEQLFGISDMNGFVLF
jgi:hypothetical protein